MCYKKKLDTFYGVIANDNSITVAAIGFGQCWRRPFYVLSDTNGVAHRPTYGWTDRQTRLGCGSDSFDDR